MQSDRFGQLLPLNLLLQHGKTTSVEKHWKIMMGNFGSIHKSIKFYFILFLRLFIGA
jgi:hypothetical protein